MKRYLKRTQKLATKTLLFFKQPLIPELLFKSKTKMCPAILPKEALIQSLHGIMKNT